jgi:hypothetical protein
MRQQQNDPIAQAMQILQFITQRRGQQAGIEQEARRLDLQEQQFQQNRDQFSRGLEWQKQDAQTKNDQFTRDLALRELAQKQAMEEAKQNFLWNQTQAKQKNEQWNAEQAQRIMENTRNNMAQPVDQAYKQMLIDKARAEMLGQDKDPQMMQAELDRDKMIAAVLQDQINNASPMERGRLQDQLQTYMYQRYKDVIPPLRDYNQDELRAMQTYQTPQ